uniref:forkhead box protein D2-like n=1 Tax=Callithrix jacchus TaxID=9483 RepID=UPI0023DD54C5|nr:forkhead box protein D2-like [Callithrix jacchus]
MEQKREACKLQNPQRSFAAANVRKCSSAELPPPPSPRPHPRSPTPGGGDLGHRGHLEDGLPSGLSQRAGGGLLGLRPPPLACQPPGPAYAALRARAPSAPRPPGPAGAPPAPPALPAPRPSAPLHSWARESAQLTPPCGGRGSGEARYIGWGRPSGRRVRRVRRVRRAQWISGSRCQTLRASGSPSSCLPLHPLLRSSPSALFSGLITFRIKAKPSPGCSGSVAWAGLRHNHCSLHLLGSSDPPVPASTVAGPTGFWPSSVRFRHQNKLKSISGSQEPGFEAQLYHVLALTSGQVI